MDVWHYPFVLQQTSMRSLTWARGWALNVSHYAGAVWRDEDLLSCLVRMYTRLCTLTTDADPSGGQVFPNGMTSSFQYSEWKVMNKRNTYCPLRI